MFVFRFIYPVKYFPRHYIRQAFFARNGHLPMRSTVSLTEENETNGILKLSVDWKEPGMIHVPWFSKRFGLTFFSTEVLRPRSEPFHLLRELVRGQMTRIIKREYEWERKGLLISDSVKKAIHSARRKMIRFLTKNPEDSDFNEVGVAVFNSLLQTSHLLLDLFLEQSLYARKVQTEAYPMFVGGRSFQMEQLQHFFEAHPSYSSAFQVWNTTYAWRQLEPEPGVCRWDLLDRFIETAQKNNLEPIFGPIVKWDRESLPPWILGTLEEPYTLRQHLFRHTDELIGRYASKINKWVVASGLGNEMDSILVQKRIEWADTMARQIRERNPDALILIGIERPWGDSLRHKSEIPPLELAETLLSRRVFDGYFVSINYGLSPEATLPRDAFELNWLLDQWSSLGKPLYVSFSVPSAPSLYDPHWDGFDGKPKPIWTLETQQENTHRSFLSLLTRKTIRGIFWNCFDDLATDAELSVEQESFDETRDDTKTFSELDDDETTKRTGELGDKEVVASERTDRRPHADPVGDSEKEGRPAEILEPAVVEIASFDDSLDTQKFLFPHSGLVKADGSPKPAFRKLVALRGAYLG
ncbi:MAG: hypothetical protein ACOX6D_03730 [Thermoguttaceae bacterium]